jgi:predicted dehydrogenase
MTPMTDKIPVLLIGAGGYGKIYAQGILAPGILAPDDPPWECVGVVSTNANAAGTNTAAFRARGIPVYASPAAFFAERQAALTVIASPIHTHYPFTALALERGSAVLCEKPVCAARQHLEDLLEREAATGLFAAVGYQRCYYRDILAFKRDIIAGRYGRPLRFKMLHLPRRGEQYYTRNSWAGKIALNGEPVLDSPLQNACGHELQLLFFLLGTALDEAAGIASLEARLWKARRTIENYDAAALRALTPSGTEVLFYTAHCAAHTAPRGEFLFEHARAVYDENEQITVYGNDGNVIRYTDSGHHLQKFYDALEAVRNNAARPVCTLKTAAPHLDCVLRAQAFPVTIIEENRIRTLHEAGDVFIEAAGLAEAFVSAYTNGALPEDI